MSKRTLFTTITPLPATVTREIAIDMLHSHTEMIELNPLVERYLPTKPPKDAPPDEFHCIWYKLTDRIEYLPGGVVSGNVSYNACFHDLPWGLQTHVYAPLGLDIKNRWSVGGNMPGEPREVQELGLGLPHDGLYLREDVDMRCSVFATRFVRKTLKKAHAVLVARLLKKGEIIEDARYRCSLTHSASQSTASTRSDNLRIVSPALYDEFGRPLVHPAIEQNMRAFQQSLKSPYGSASTGGKSMGNHTLGSPYAPAELPTLSDPTELEDSDIIAHPSPSIEWSSSPVYARPVSQGRPFSSGRPV